MGKILPSFKKTLVDEIITNISSNTSYYYGFAANPIPYTDLAPEVANNDYATMFINDWQMILGKKLNPGDVVPVIKKNLWTANTVYTRYDNTSDAMYEGDNFYVISEPPVVGGSYHIYKCIDNANNRPSIVDPGSIGMPAQSSTIQTSDNYKWKYISSISSANYDKFVSENYAPVYTNTTIATSAAKNSGVELVVIERPGSGYVSYNAGTVRSVQNTTTLQIENDASSSDNFYVESGIYIYNNIDTTSQIRTVSDYVVNSSGKFIYVDPPINTETVVSGISQYLISPAVVFEDDGDISPKAYSVVNTANYSLEEIVMLDPGSNISWANVSIKSSYGSGANVYAIVPPPGGHGSDPVSELGVKGLAVTFSFNNGEYGNVVTANVTYNKIGIVKDPFTIESNTASGETTKGPRFTGAAYNQLLKANVSPSYIFSPGEVVVGSDSKAMGTVVFSNSTQVFLSGDKHFIEGEYISNTAGIDLSRIFINTVGSIYTKDLVPLYIENINNVKRANNQTETYKLTIEL